MKTYFMSSVLQTLMDLFFKTNYESRSQLPTTNLIINLETNGTVEYLIIKRFLSICGGVGLCVCVDPLCVIRIQSRNKWNC